MGNFRSSPNSEKRISNGEAGPYQYGTCAMQGWRISMEDAHLIHLFDWLEQPGSPGALFGVFDGHGGAHVAHFVREHLVQELVKAPEFKKGRFEVAFRKAYLSLDNLLPLESSQSELERFSRVEPLATFGATPVGTSRESDPSSSLLVDSSTAAAPGVSLLELDDDDDDDDVDVGVDAATSPHRDAEGVECSARTPNSLGLSSVNSRPETQNPRPGSNTATKAPTLKLGGRRLCRRQNAADAADKSADAQETVPGIDADAAIGSDSEVVSSSQPAKPASVKNTSGAVSVSKSPGVSSTGTSSAASIGSHDTTHGATATTTPGASNNSVLHSLKALFSGVIRVGNGLPRQGNGGYNGLAMLAGCTAVSVLVLDSKFIVANAGDSRCVLCRGKLAVDISRDHKPTLPSERSRIYSAGGWLEMGRVNGNLNLSRAIGDLTYKANATLPPERQIVSAVPDLMSSDITEEDEFLIIGCDGVWESSTSQEIVNFIRERINTATQLSDILEALFEELLSPNPSLFEYGCDNMTAIIVDLHPERRRRSCGSTQQESAAVSVASPLSSPKLSSAASPTKDPAATRSSSSRKGVPPLGTRGPAEELATPAPSTVSGRKPIAPASLLPIFGTSREAASL